MLKYQPLRMIRPNEKEQSDFSLYKEKGFCEEGVENVQQIFQQRGLWEGPEVEGEAPEHRLHWPRAILS